MVLPCKNQRFGDSEASHPAVHGLLCEAPITSGTAQEQCPYGGGGVRDFGDFCEGYKRFGHGHIRLDNFSEICPRFILVTLTNRD